MPRLPPLRQGVRLGAPLLTEAENKAVIDHDKCKGCGRCIGACNFDAIIPPTTAPTSCWTARSPSTQGRVPRPSLLPYFSGAGHQPQLRLPLRERRTHPAGYRHLRVLRPGGAGPGLRRRLPGTPPRCPTASWARTLQSRAGTATTTTSRTPTPTSSGRPPLNRPRRWAWAPASMC